jgi:predicted nucleic-acid-binding Zn-ribbon protein
MDNPQTDEDKIYKQKLSHFISSISNSRFVIEVSKFCGYSEFVLVYKNQTLADLYKTISLHFECNDIKGLYLTNSAAYRVPVTENITIRSFIMKSKDIIKPIYKLPLPVVYKFFLDDGHCCIDTVKLGDHV